MTTAQPGEEMQQPGAQVLERRVVLIVDDSPDDRELLVRLLRRSVRS